LTEQKRLLKNIHIKESMLATMNKRNNQKCSVYTIKIDESKLTTKQKEHLKMLFIEAKWIANDIIHWSENNNISDYNCKSKTINVLNKNKEYVTKPLQYIGSQMKQSILSEILSNIKGLSILKKHNHKVGKLKYRSTYKSLNLKQYNNTYKIYNNKKMKIQGVPGKIIVNGLNQCINIPNIEYANAKILNTPMGYYISITTYVYKNDIHTISEYLPEIGIDMGIKTHITTSEGKKYNVSIEETERLKRLQKKEFRQNKGSNNRYKTRNLINIEYQKITNRKKDATNKIVFELLKHERIYMQDENLTGWKKFAFGKQIQHSILGSIKAKLINHPRIEIIDKFAPTSKLCICGNKKTDLKLTDRVYHCDICGYTEDRDIHAAKNMIRMIKIIQQRLVNDNNLPREPRDVKPVEINTSDYRKYNNMIDNKVLSVKQEAHQSLDCA
jgi:putative transposase